MAGRPLPVVTPPPLPLDSLLARAGLRAQAHTSPTSAAGAAGATARHLTQPTSPTALVLVITVSQCECGAVVRSPAAYALARYELNANSFRYSRASTSDCAGLPRERREQHVRVPFCEECF